MPVSRSQTLTDKSGHFAWYALIALKLAISNVLTLCEAQQNASLPHFLTVALKQR